MLPMEKLRIGGVSRIVLIIGLYAVDHVLGIFTKEPIMNTPPPFPVVPVADYPGASSWPPAVPPVRERSGCWPRPGRYSPQQQGTNPLSA